MSDLEKLIVCAIVVAVMVGLIGPPAVRRIAGAAADRLIVILALIWVLNGLALPC